MNKTFWAVLFVGMAVLVLYAPLRKEKGTKMAKNWKTVTATASAGSYRIVGTSRGGVLFFNPLGETVTNQHDRAITTLAVSPDLRWVVSGDTGCRLLLWDLTNCKCVRELWDGIQGVESKRRILQLDFTDDNQWVRVNALNVEGEPMVRYIHILSGNDLDFTNYPQEKIDAHLAVYELARQRGYWNGRDPFSPSSGLITEYYRRQAAKASK